MQDKYAGDAGDFQKFGLLRSLCLGEQPLTLGVCWYRVADESGQLDGKHIRYLTAPGKRNADVKQCDSDLFEALKVMIENGPRSLTQIETMDSVLPNKTVFSGKVVPGRQEGRDRQSKLAERQRWHDEVLEIMRDVDLVYLDPDNGIRFDTRTAMIHKYTTSEELRSHVLAGKSVVCYHHYRGTKGETALKGLQRKLAQVDDAVGAKPLGGVIARLGTVRFFVVIPAECHRAFLSARLEGFSKRWTPFATYYPYDQD